MGGGRKKTGVCSERALFGLFFGEIGAFSAGMSRRSGAGDENQPRLASGILMIPGSGGGGGGALLIPPDTA